jgi:hypothetical protein
VNAWKRFGALSPEKALRDMPEFGRSGCLSRLVDLKTHTEPPDVEPDSDNEFDDEHWELSTMLSGCLSE